MKVPHKRHRVTHVGDTLFDFGNGPCRLFVVHGNADDFAPGPRQLRHLHGRPARVGGVGVGHGLHDNWVP